ncbi:hypothetical protein Droror1_Dr00017447 [Drosera rotundifolia]
MSNCSGLELHIGCKTKRKKWPGERRAFRLKSFGNHGYPAEFNRSFWRNVKALLEHGDFESNLVTSKEGVMLSCWSFELELHRHRPERTVFLFVVEELVESSSGHRHCKHCQYIGWGHYMACNVNYHIVMPSKVSAKMGATCLSSCRGSNCDGEAFIRNKRLSSLLEVEGHALHGVFHCNGFGHLLSLNGLEMGSELAGHHLMDLWDRLCTGLHAKKVSLTDISEKKGMDLRLLHGVTYAAPWFGRWGYQFARGSFGVTESMYQKAIQAIQNIPLCLLLPQLGASEPYISLVFTRYQSLSDHSLITIGDLLHFMLELRSRLPKEPSMESHNPGILLDASCRWSQKRVEMATRVIVDALKRAESKWISRQEVRDAARSYIGDTGLLDFVLKSLGNHVVGNYLVRRSLNPVTKVLEYCLETVSGHESHNKGSTCKITRFQLAKDIFYVYKYVLKERKPELNCSGLLTAMPVATRIILDTKYFFKDFHWDLQSRAKSAIEEGTIEIFCSLQIKDKNSMQTLPSECFTVSRTMTVDDLIHEVEKCFREMYFGLRSLVVEAITNLNGEGNEAVIGIVEDGTELVFEGVIDAMESQGTREPMGLIDEKYVDCGCGAKTDDGERMVACDICEAWQHTRCAKIPDHEDIPRIFLCNRCEQGIVLSPSLI